ncbi:hypothetical protein HN992_00600 [Candidatus Woesearchaeota archaeon]|nr:hypothetical protein [Candidatus Woesearchaeota archaeon]
MSYLVTSINKENNNLILSSALKSKLRNSSNLILNYQRCLKNGNEIAYLEILTENEELLIKANNIPKYAFNEHIYSILTEEAKCLKNFLGEVAFKADVKGFYSYGENDQRAYGSLI